MPRLLAVLAALFAVPLVLFGGSVTTLGAGMAVEGWLIAEGHFLLFFPVESWFRDVGTFVEHTHRLFGALVGLAAAGACGAAWVRDGRRGAGWLATGAFLAVCGQGALGGFRVLESSHRLAFLHGVLAQGVFAVLCASALLLSRRWTAAGSPGVAPAGAARLRRLSLVATILVFAQVFVGAWYRHGLRPVTEPGTATRLLLHVGGAVLVLVALALLAQALLAAAAAADQPARSILRGARRRLLLLLALQIALGLASWLGFRPDAIGPFEWGLSILHVLGGALLLAQTVCIAMWSHHLLSAAEPAGGMASRPRLEAMR